MDSLGNDAERALICALMEAIVGVGDDAGPILIGILELPRDRLVLLGADLTSFAAALTLTVATTFGTTAETVAGDYLFEPLMRVSASLTVDWDDAPQGVRDMPDELDQAVDASRRSAFDAVTATIQGDAPNTIQQITAALDTNAVSFVVLLAAYSAQLLQNMTLKSGESLPATLQKYLAPFRD